MSEHEWWRGPSRKRTLLLTIFFVPLLGYLVVEASADGSVWPLIVVTFMYVALAATEWSGWD